MEWVGFPRTDPFFTDLSGLTLQSGVGVGPGGRLVKDEYTVGGGGTAAAAAAAAVGSAMDVDGEMNQTIQHHPPTQATASNNAQQTQQGFITGLSQPNPSKLSVTIVSFYLLKLPLYRNFYQIFLLHDNFTSFRSMYMEIMSTNDAYTSFLFITGQHQK